MKKVKRKKKLAREKKTGGRRRRAGWDFISFRGKERKARKPSDLHLRGVSQVWLLWILCSSLSYDFSSLAIFCGLLGWV